MAHLCSFTRSSLSSTESHGAESGAWTSHAQSGTHDTRGRHDSSTSSRPSLDLRRSALTDIVFVPTEGMTNATFEVELCKLMNSGVTYLSISTSVASSVSGRFLLPDCVFVFSNLISISAQNVILQGNTSYPDPLDRLGVSMNAPSTTSIILTGSALLPIPEAPYTPIWNLLFSRFSMLSTLMLDSCGLSGVLPTRLPSQLLTFSINDNHLNGSIPSTLLDGYVSSTMTSPDFSWTMTNNNLEGTIPPSLFASLPAQSTFSFIANGNSLSGSIPLELLNLTPSSTTKSIKIDFGRNSLTGALPPDLWGLPKNSPSLTVLTIVFSNNRLTGTIPLDWVSQYSFPSASVFTITLDSNQLTGSISSALLPASAPQLTLYSLSLTQNALNSSIDDNFLLNTLSLGTDASATTFISLSIAFCSLTGEVTLPTPPQGLTKLPFISLAASSNSLTSFSAGVNSSKYLYWIDLSGNPEMQGNLDNVFTFSSQLVTLSFSNTMMSGTMPNMGLVDTSNLYMLRLDKVAIDFCSEVSNRISWNSSSLSSCSLLETNARDCPALYPSQCSTDAVPMTPNIPSLIPTPSPCPQSTRPSLQFQCINGIWVSNTTVTTPTLTIPSGASETIIVGDIESSSIVFSGLGSTLTIEGCALNLTSITLTLTPDDLKGSSKIVQQLIIFANSNCSNDNLNGVVVEGRLNGSTCRKVKASKTISNGQLSGIFTIDSSPCNTWWIILVSVICGVVVLGVLILVLLIIFVPKVRFAVRPYSRPRDDKSVHQRNV